MCKKGRFFFPISFFVIIFAKRITKEDYNIQNLYKYENLQDLGSNASCSDAVYGSGASNRYQ